MAEKDGGTGGEGGASGNGGTDGGDGGGAGAVMHDIVIDGETVQVSLDDLKSGHLRQSDYTKKTTAVAVKEKAMDKHIEDRATELFLQAQADSRGSEDGGEGEGGDNGSEGEKGADQRETKLQARMEKLESSNQSARDEQTNRETDKEISGILEGLRKEFPLADDRIIRIRVHAEMQDHDDVEQTFKRIASEEHNKMKKRDLDNIDSYIKTKKMPHSSGETGKSATGVGGKEVKPPQTFAEARAASRARIAPGSD